MLYNCHQNRTNNRNLMGVTHFQTGYTEKILLDIDVENGDQCHLLAILHNTYANQKYTSFSPN